MESILDFMIIHPLQTIHPILQSPNIPIFQHSTIPIWARSPDSYRGWLNLYLSLTVINSSRLVDHQSDTNHQRKEIAMVATTWPTSNWPEGVSHDVSDYEKPLFSILDDSARDYPNQDYTIFSDATRKCIPQR